jgi:hypothetical protein
MESADQVVRRGSLRLDREWLQSLLSQLRRASDSGASPAAISNEKPGLTRPAPHSRCWNSYQPDHAPRPVTKEQRVSREGEGSSGKQPSEPIQGLAPVRDSGRCRA